MKEITSGERNQAILQAVKSLKKSQFGEHGVTAIKVEFEAQFDRRRGNSSCSGSHECYECYGDWEDRGECGQCEGHGYYRQINGDWENCAEEDAGAVECDDCYGSGVSICNVCEEGRVDCDGDCDEEYSNFASALFCHDWLMEKLSHFGLAEQKDEYFCLAHGEYSVWHPVHPLTYAEFYNDGSVDSEFTVTVMIDNPENVFLTEKIERAFISLGEEIGNGRNVRGAGMHIALLATPDGSYGRRYNMTYSDAEKFRNFKSSMELLLPALYCLGASDEQSRGLSYRRPTIGVDTHRAAIDYRHGALEFRIFDTTYNHPEKILDNIVVISKCLRYWSLKKIDNGLSKVTQRTQFGDKGGDKLERFYFKAEHIDLLNQGLRKLKPSYLSISEIKEQRGIKVNKRSIMSKLKAYRRQVESEYSEYVERFDWSLLANRHRRLADAVEGSKPGTPMAEIEAHVNRRIAELQKQRQNLEQYVGQRLNEYNNTEGAYTLSAE